jgi:hypothetical protein
MINKKEIQNNQIVNNIGLEKRLNEAVSPAGGGWGWTIKGDCYSCSLFVEVCLESRGKEKIVKDIQNVSAVNVKNIDDLERKNMDKFVKVHPQPPPAGDIAIAQVSAKKILSSEEYYN